MVQRHFTHTFRLVSLVQDTYFHFRLLFITSVIISRQPFQKKNVMQKSFSVLLRSHIFYTKEICVDMLNCPAASLPAMFVLR